MTIATGIVIVACYFGFTFCFDNASRLNVRSDKVAYNTPSIKKTVSAIISDIVPCVVQLVILAGKNQHTFARS